MTATAHQRRRRHEAADTIVARFGTTALRKQFVKAGPLDVTTPTADTLYAAIAAYTDPSVLLALADEIATTKRRRPRRRKTENAK